MIGAAVMRRRLGLTSLATLLVLLGSLLFGCAMVRSPATGLDAQSIPGCPAPSLNTPGASASGLPLRALCALPREATKEWRTIENNGRQTYSRDGIVFDNAERQLPMESRGYYREYTVPTSGATTRGARRLITGMSHELYYTDDHYKTFVVVDPTTPG